MMAVTNSQTNKNFWTLFDAILWQAKSCAGGPIFIGCELVLTPNGVVPAQDFAFLFHVKACKDQIMKNLVYLLEPFLLREIKRVAKHNAKARQRNLPATLTIRQWLRNCRLFEYKCAYCKTGRFESLEHVVPLSMGGGTTADNCAPCCEACNLAHGRMTERQVSAKKRLQALQVEAL